MNAANLAKVEGLFRPLAVRILPKKTLVSIYSKARLNFIDKLNHDVPKSIYLPPERFNRILWGIKFRSPIMNSAGMFKNAECYEVMEKQGAGAYLGGTGTWNSRKGNEKNEISLPFSPYPLSHSASNWLGLPNDGDEANSKKAREMKKGKMPIGWSLMGSPNYEGEEKLKKLIKSMVAYEKAGVDFLEINESCPNTSHGKPQEDDLANRLIYINKNFLNKRKRTVPVIVKFSNDTKPEQIPELLNLLFEMGFDGVNFGNTSTDYELRRKEIDVKEVRVFDYFTKTFGGGVSGKPLKNDSLKLATLAVKHLKKAKPKQEFHVIRTGGIETWEDIEESEKAGISMNQWFTGYFESFAKHSHSIYKKLLEDH
ncbi:hypothetical protein HY448_02820 [Candidatus Pacearchaeota archaeon]|nr:hypothetical protein [Candidatus Pacearchaeota archaeon]